MNVLIVKLTEAKYREFTNLVACYFLNPNENKVIN
jgi:hypothetical protein